jgi:hypothetical protein
MVTGQVHRNPSFLYPSYNISRSSKNISTVKQTRPPPCHCSSHTRSDLPVCQSRYVIRIATKTHNTFEKHNSFHQNAIYLRFSLDASLVLEPSCFLIANILLAENILRVTECSALDEKYSCRQRMFQPRGEAARRKGPIG